MSYCKAPSPFLLSLKVMANPLSKKLKKGTLGELLVQLRLLQYDVQAAPPLKDTGNDLVAIKRNNVRVIQVKTRTDGKKLSEKRINQLFS